MPTEKQSQRLDELLASLAAAKAAHVEAPAAPVNANEYSAPSGPDGSTVVLQDNLNSMPRVRGATVTDRPQMNTQPPPFADASLFEGQRRNPAPRSLEESLGAPPVPRIAVPPPPALPTPSGVPLPSIPVPQRPLTIGTEYSENADISELLFFTGQSKAGLSYLIKAIGAVEVSASESADLLAANLFGQRIGKLPGGQQAINRLVAYGDGTYTEQYPASLERALLMQTIAGLDGWSGYGTPGYWVNNLMEAATRVRNETGKRVVITGVNDARTYKSLTEAGYQAWHIMASPAKRTARGATPVGSQFHTGLDHSVIKQISAQPNGKRLHAVWSDEGVNPNSPRIWTADAFIGAAQIATITEPAGDVLNVE